MTSSDSCHISVLPAEVIQWLDPQPGKLIVDGTYGGGGHTKLLAERVLPRGRVIAVDLDPLALHRRPAGLSDLPVDFAVGNFCDIPAYLAEKQIAAVDGVLLDLGLSSDQLADVERGFSFQAEGPLDLRFDVEEGEPAWRLLERLSEKAIADIIYQYGEERGSRRIARRLVAQREDRPVRTAAELAALVRACVPSSRNSRIDPATRTFQALRIAVNHELESLETALRDLPECLAIGGRVAIISFHSLEDRLVKYAFRDDERLEALTRRPLEASEQEVAENPRSRSAKLRVAERRQ